MAVMSAIPIAMIILGKSIYSCQNKSCVQKLQTSNFSFSAQSLLTRKINQGASFDAFDVSDMRIIRDTFMLKFRQLSELKDFEFRKQNFQKVKWFKLTVYAFLFDRCSAHG